MDNGNQHVHDVNVALYRADYALGSSAYCTGEPFDPKWSEAKMDGWIDTSYEQAMQEDCMNIK